MISFHALFAELAQREVRCLHFLPEAQPSPGPPPDECAYVEFYCDEPDCDCRRVI